MAFSELFRYASTVVSVYAFVCFVRIFMTWIPQANYSKFGRTLSRICDPFLDLFRHLPLRFAGFDFSAAVALCVLWGISYVLGSLSQANAITPKTIAILALSLVWNIISSILILLIVVIAIRLIVLFMTKSTYGTIWDTLDRSISPMLFRIAAPFYKGRSISFRGALVISLVALAVSYIVLRTGTERLFMLLAR
ncbi:MAG: YggT family protein [Treponema sp.]|uniref:YggT family protein n=1 Tax=Treponema sp. TaxID=166 RepID=UPI002580D13D|nr:YggT family protein [Treponema sp.]MBQ5537397.1 YggT family protein [Treponema sp.]